MEIGKITNECEEITKLKQGSQVLILRHGNSVYNLAESQMNESGFSHEAYRALRINKELRDAQLSSLGIEQWEKAQKLANQMKVHTVFVSPLRRALETAYHVYKTHPNFENIKFHLTPLLREALDTACDIPVNVLETVEEFKQKFKHFDVSELDSYSDIPHYFLTDIKQEFSSKIMSNKVADSEDPIGSNAMDLLLETIDENYSTRLESTKNVLSRVLRAKKIIQKYIEDNNIEEDAKIVCVGHSYCFKVWTGKWDRGIEEYDDVPEPKSHVWLENCQFLADNDNFPPENKNSKA